MSQNQDMTQLIISHEDQSLIEAHGLGPLLALYHAPRREIRYLTFSSIILFLALCVFIILTLIDWQHVLALSAQHPRASLAADPLSTPQWQLSTEQLMLFRSLVDASMLFLLELFLLFVSIPAEKSRRVMVCEYGLLQIRKRLQGQRVEMIYWEEIQAIEPVFTWTEQTRLIRKEGKPLALPKRYERFDELLAQIRLCSNNGGN